jgi:hypothetical protein
VTAFVRQRAPKMEWHRAREVQLVRQDAFADAAGLHIVRVRAATTLVRLPPWLSDLDEDLNERDDGQPPLVEVLDIHRAVRGLRDLGYAVGEITEDGWEGLATITLPNIGTFRLVGTWLPGWDDELDRNGRDDGRSSHRSADAPKEPE